MQRKVRLEYSVGCACTCTSIEVSSAPTVVSASPVAFASTSMVTSHGLVPAVSSVAELVSSESHGTLPVSRATHEAAAASGSVPSSVRVRLRPIVLSPPSVLVTDSCSSSATT